MIQASNGLYLGKKAARPKAMKFALSSYVDRSKIPTPPPSFGHQNLIKRDWGMLGNDEAGCCVWCDGAHATMLWNAEAGKTVRFTGANVLSDYSAATDYDPAKPETDQGTDMQVAAEYRRTTGIIDAAGKRHKIGAYLALDPGSLTDLWAATYLFGTVSIGIQLPQSAIDQFDAGKEWTYVRGSPIVGGHCTTLVGKRDDELLLVTWGKVQACTTYAFTRFCDEVVAYVSEEALVSGRSPEGFDMVALVADLGRLRSA